MGELISGFVQLLALMAQVIAEVTVFLLMGSVAVIGYCVSKSYRERKQFEWQGRKWLKSFELGFSGLCLATLVVLVVCGAVAASGARRSEREQAKRRESGQLEIGLHSRSTNGQGKDIHVKVKDDGLAKIMASQNLKDLAKQIKENVTVTNAAADALTTNKFKLEVSYQHTSTPWTETNQ